MNPLRQWKNELTAQRAVKVLAEKGYNAVYAKSLAEAREKLFEMIPEGSSIGLGGSETLAAMNILEELRTDKYRLFDRYNCKNHFEVCRDSLMSDVFITGTNAVTLNGELVNIDCSGSRTAAIMYGPRKVIVVVGANKIVPDIAHALERLKEIAPMNVKRLHHGCPCETTGFCADCNAPNRMCNHIGITLNAQKFPGRLNVIVVAEEAGF